MRRLFERWRRRARQLKVETYAIYLAYRDPRVPWYARIFAAFVAAYAFSPVDLIPDVIPVVGYLDDLVLVPLGIALALRMIPGDVLTECREQAQETLSDGRDIGRAGTIAIVAIWILLAALVIVAAVRTARS